MQLVVSAGGDGDVLQPTGSIGVVSVSSRVQKLFCDGSALTIALPRGLMRQLLKNIFRFYLHNEYIFTLVTILVMKKYRLFIFPVVLALLLSSVTAIIMMIGQQPAFAQVGPSACPDPGQCTL